MANVHHDGDKMGEYERTCKSDFLPMLTRRKHDLFVVNLLTGRLRAFARLDGATG